MSDKVILRIAEIPPLVPVGTTFPPQAGAQQGSARHFLYKLLHSKHGLFCSHLRGKETASLKLASPIYGGGGPRNGGRGRLVAAKAPYFARLAHPMQDGPQHNGYLPMVDLFHCIST